MKLCESNNPQTFQSSLPEPAVVLVLRGVNAFKRLDFLIRVQPASKSTPGPGPSLERILSATPELAYRQTMLFFQDKELFADDAARTLLKYLPPVRAAKMAEQDDRCVKYLEQS